jgi:prepilin-type processing-associated H-X9-DG protein
VVISIVALLVSLLLPSLQSAREVSRQSVCASDLRQMFFAQSARNQDLKFYIADRNNYYHQRGRDNDLTSPQGCYRSVFLDHYIPGLPDGATTNTQVPSTIINLMICPSNFDNPRKNYANNISTQACRTDDRRVLVHLHTESHTSFSENGNYFYTGGGISNPNPGWTGGLMTRLKDSDIFRPAEWVFSGDFTAGDPNGWPDGYNDGWTYTSAYYTNHAQGGNYNFYDGHIKFINRSDLWAAGEVMWPKDTWAFWYNNAQRVSGSGVYQGLSGSSLINAENVISPSAIQ